jgi:hypothetical protein
MSFMGWCSVTRPLDHASHAASGPNIRTGFLDAVPHFHPVDGNASWGCDSKSDRVPVDPKNSDLDIVANNNPLPGLP